MTERDVTAATVCLYFGTKDECPYCGGWSKAEGGPFHAVDETSVFCSEDCYSEAQECAERARHERETAWCPFCSYDNHEHDPECLSGRHGRAEKTRHGWWCDTCWQFHDTEMETRHLPPDKDTPKATS